MAGQVGKAALSILRGPRHHSRMEEQDSVILLHGLGRSSGSMAGMALALRRAGFQVVNYDYPSTSGSVAELAARVLPEAFGKCAPGRVHLVTHSLGGILLRHWMQGRDEPRLGRVVMLGPPNGGSEIVDNLKDLPPFGWINGPAGQELGTDGVAAALGPVNFELGVIAGTLSLNPAYGAMIEGENDGKVSVKSTEVAGMAAHLVLPVSHTWMMWHPVVIAESLAFLRGGLFKGLSYAEALESLTN